jgi:N-acetylmuramoyl-L-alanine amidase
MLKAPQLRGDDVVELQVTLNQLGFDCGRPDGIFGPATVRALIDFQRNAGLVSDGLCGHDTVRSLEIVKRQSGSGPGVASIRETQAHLATPAALTSLRLVIGQFGGLSALTRALSRSLRHRGATVMSTDEYEAHAQAAAANRFAAHAYLGFEARVEPCSTFAYFSVPTFESIGGRSLAEHLRDAVSSELGVTAAGNPPISPEVVGMRIPVLRETRMPAVLCSMGPVRAIVDGTARLTPALAGAVQQWAEGPADTTGIVRPALPPDDD